MKSAFLSGNGWPLDQVLHQLGKTGKCDADQRKAILLGRRLDMDAFGDAVDQGRPFAGGTEPWSFGKTRLPKAG